ncbi:signal peptidase II [Neisseria chenwenguii]|uniref:Lipoprotein signal peptidase n=1 Tax=Neisseria chenwenguii TaxID=1853278 RepID=A0A220S0E0_9NEIS|nr:signal peptidase II [Neisseria chenwenguii]ASK26939.1 signal peptidase II [Neisseria chenwenguii]ROV56739.1 lipoprotein signal peptidase [Neisseria chenwenguii]
MSARSKIPYLLLAVAAIAFDQLTKLAALSAFSYAERLNVVPGFFDLTLVYNPGAAFSFLADAGGWQKYFFLGLAVLISGYLARGIWREEFGRWGRLGAAMIIGGAVGNVIDRLAYGHVIDFLLFYWKDWYYPAFNIADSFICVGAVLLVIDGFGQKKKAAV